MPATTDLTGGGSTWEITNTGGTDNGLPAGGGCDDEEAGFTVEDADIPAGSDAYDNGQMVWVDDSVFVAPGPISAMG